GVLLNGPWLGSDSHCWETDISSRSSSASTRGIIRRRVRRPAGVDLVENRFRKNRAMMRPLPPCGAGGLRGCESPGQTRPPSPPPFSSGRVGQWDRKLEEKLGCCFREQVDPPSRERKRPEDGRPPVAYAPGSLSCWSFLLPDHR